MIPETLAKSSGFTDSHPGGLRFETELLNKVHKGDLDYQQVWSHSIYASPTPPDVPVADTLTVLKYRSVTLSTLCANTAIRGGAPSNSVYMMHDRNLAKIYHCATVSDLLRLNEKIYRDFIQEVNERRRLTAQSSKAVQVCCDYINSHLTERICITDISSLLGYSDYYISKLFREQTGSKLQDYILQQKISYAKMRLAGSTDSVQRISEELHFSSRSHFSRIFEKHTGITPGKWRKMR